MCAAYGLTSQLGTIPRRPLTPDVISLLADLTAYYVGEDSFPILQLSGSSDALAECEFFAVYPYQQIGIIFVSPFLLISWFLC